MKRPEGFAPLSPPQCGRLALAFGLGLASACGKPASNDAAPPPIAPVTASPTMPRLVQVPLVNLPGDLDLRPHNLALTSQGEIVVWVRGDRDHWLRTLDSTGKVVSIWGRPGEGPGEVGQADLLLSGDSSVVLARVVGEPLREFAPDGTLLADRRSPPAGLPSTLENGSVLCWTAKHVGASPGQPTKEALRDRPVMA